MQEVTWSTNERDDFGEEKRLYNDSIQIYKKKNPVLKKIENGDLHCI